MGGTQATVTFTTSEPTAVTFELKEVTGAPVQPPSQPPGPLGGVRAPITGGVATTGDTPPPASFKTMHQLVLKPLKSNTTYDVFVVATTQSGQRLTGSARFTTLKLRVRVTLEEITIEDDGDGIFRGDGDPRWDLDLTSGWRLCYPITCGTYGNWGEGRIVPRDVAGNRLSWLLHEEAYHGLLDALTMTVRAFEDDPGRPHACVGEGCDGNPTIPASATWRRPQGVESASARVRVRGDDGRGFKSLLTFTFEVFHDATNYVIN